MIAYPKILTIYKSEFYTVGQHIMISDDNSKIAAGKSNTAILLILENELTNFKFGVITYHMPLEPKIEEVSLTHSKVLFKKIIKFMNDIIWFFAGDFNITPNSKAYSYITKLACCIWKDCINCSNQNCSNQNCSNQKLITTSTTYPITNHAYIRNFEFSGCLDYIFFSTSKKIECIDIKYTIINSIIPNINHSSDHISIYAKFNII